MRVTYNWLKEYVDIDLTAAELAARLDLTGIEVESLVHLGDGFDRVVVGKIVSIEPHPNADRLSCCLVDVGREKPAEIVCGAKNIKTDDLVPVALPGANLPNGLKIKISKLRGRKSEGMMCSAAELQLGKDAGGILILPVSAQIGAPISQVLELDDYLFELEVTPNRPDCLGVIGLAREVAAITGGKFKIPNIKAVATGTATDSQIEVKVEAADLCPRYVACLFKDVSIGPSPIWLIRRLEAVGIRAVNNIVDITNYIMMETGQPLHAFDFDLIKGAQIVVRRAQAGENLITIDHIKRELNPEMLLITDAKHPLALAGVMGGFDSEISAQTTSVLLESAAFLPTNIMRTSRSLELITESSYRFEKGVDVNGCLYAAERAALLMVELAGAQLQTGAIDIYPKKLGARKVNLRPARANQILGTKISRTKMATILNGLELSTKAGPKKDALTVTIPTFRVDLEREIDLIEEIARVYGLNKIPPTLPLSTAAERGLSPLQLQRQALRQIMLSAGFNEAVNYTFIGNKELDFMTLPDGHPWRRAPRLTNPISEEQKLLRTSLLPGLLRNVKHNLNHGQNNVRIFEMGTIFLETSQVLPTEILELGGLLSGDREPSNWLNSAGEVDFFDIKGMVEIIAEQANLNDYDFRPATHASLHPGSTAELLAEGEVVGLMGQVHPDVQRAYGIKQKVFVFQIEVDNLLGRTISERAFREIGRLPGVELDLALVVDERTANEQIKKVIRDSGEGLLKELRLFDLYRGSNLPPGKKSLAYALTYRSDKRTLREKEVQKIHQRIIRKVFQELGATLRE